MSDGQPVTTVTAVTAVTAGAVDVTPAEAPLGRLEGAAFMATGAALVAHILVDMPLWLSVALALSAAACVMFVAAKRHPERVRAG
jgi:hypothetical protein